MAYRLRRRHHCPSFQCTSNNTGRSIESQRSPARGFIVTSFDPDAVFEGQTFNEKKKSERERDVCDSGIIFMLSNAVIHTHTHISERKTATSPHAKQYSRHFFSQPPTRRVHTLNRVIQIYLTNTITFFHSFVFIFFSRT